MHRCIFFSAFSLRICRLMLLLTCDFDPRSRPLAKYQSLSLLHSMSVSLFSLVDHFSEYNSFYDTWMPRYCRAPNSSSKNIAYLSVSQCLLLRFLSTMPSWPTISAAFLVVYTSSCFSNLCAIQMSRPGQSQHHLYFRRWHNFVERG